MNPKSKGIQYSDNCSVNQMLKVDQASTNCEAAGHQLSEQNLKQLQNKLLLLIQHNPLPIIEWNTAFEIIEWNPAAEKLFGYRKNEVLGCQITQVIVPESDRVKVNKMMELLLEKEVEGNNLSNNLTKNLTKNQKIIICEWSNTPIIDCDGKVISIVSTVQDVTKIKSFETALRQNEKTYQQILDAITDMVLVKGAKSRIIWANKAFCNYYGMSDEQLQDMIDAPFSELDHTIQYIKDDAYVFETGQTLEIPQEPVNRHDGEVRLFYTIKSAIRDEQGQVVMTVGVSRDISENQQAEKEQHNRPAIEIIKEYGNLPLVECYPGQINQVFMNILVNALDALEERDTKRSLEQMQQIPSSIRVSTEVSDNKKQVVIRFVDNGLGIPENVLKRLFDPFFTTKAVGTGTGLGLSISYQIVVDKHKGKLTCLSLPQQSTEFQIEIPINLNHNLEPSKYTHIS